MYIIEKYTQIILDLYQYDSYIGSLKGLVVLLLVTFVGEVWVLWKTQLITPDPLVVTISYRSCSSISDKVHIAVCLRQKFNLYLL